METFVMTCLPLPGARLAPQQHLATGTAWQIDWHHISVLQDRFFATQDQFSLVGY